MLRFVFNFILFGFIFFLLNRFLPDAFGTLVEWMNSVWDVLVNLFEQLVDKINEAKNA